MTAQDAVDTDPIAAQTPAELSRRRVDGWRILACVSTAVSVATIATLVWTVTKLADDEPTPAERLSAAAGVTSEVVAPPPAPVVEPAPTVPVAQSEPVVQKSDSADWNLPLSQYLQPQPTMPVGVREGAPPAPAAPVWPFAANAPMPNVALTPNIMLPPGTLSIDAIIAAVSGTAGWVGGGTLDLIGDVIVASAADGAGPQGPGDALAALMAPLSRIPPPQIPRELDVTKIPPPQWPRELDVTKIPPPQWPRFGPPRFF